MKLARQAMAHPIQTLANSVVNPFEVSACIPDGTPGKGCFSVKQTFSLSTGAAGTVVGAWFTGLLDKLFTTDTGGTTGNTTIGANWSTPNALGSIQANYRSYRCVSFGFKAFYKGNTNTDGGTIYVFQIPDTYPLSAWSGSTPASNVIATQYFETFMLRQGAVVTWRPDNMMAMTTWYAVPAAASATTVNVGMPYIGVMVDGANQSQAILQIEAVWNFEGQFSGQGFLPGGMNSKATDAAAEPGWYEKVKNLTEKIEPLVPIVGTLVKNYDSISNSFQQLSSALGYGSNGYPMIGQSIQGFYPGVD